MPVKRARIEENQADDEKSPFVPNNYQFNFIPTLKQNQKIFDFDIPSNFSQPPAELSIHTLTHRFKERLRKSRLKNIETHDQVALVNPQQQELSTSHASPQQPLYIKHQEIAYTAIVYIQMAFNVIISSTVIYVFFKIILVVKQDFDLKAKEMFDNLHREKLVCSNNYIINKCGHYDRIPAIEEMCNDWAACMNKEMIVPQAKVSAEAIAEIINSFVEPISYKTLFFFLLLIIGTIAFSNVAIHIFKRPKQTLH